MSKCQNDMKDSVCNIKPVHSKSKNNSLFISEVVEVEVNRAYDTRRKQLLSVKRAKTA